jgi:hypothetical protein
LNNDGSPWLTTRNVLSPGVNGKDNDAQTAVNYAKHTYSQRQFEGVSFPSFADESAPNLQSSSSAVQQALQSGQMTQVGTTTVNGTQAIALSFSATGRARRPH